MKPLKQFKLKYKDKWWHVRVFNTKQDMWQWYKEWCTIAGKQVDADFDFTAIHCPYTRITIDKEGGEWEHDNIGQILFL